MRSSSSRRTWIEIGFMAKFIGSKRSSSSRRTWIEIPMKTICPGCGTVVLLAEDVDRNAILAPDTASSLTSSSSRRTWIEIHHTGQFGDGHGVVLLAEDVDRNDLVGVEATSDPGRPPRGGRG